DFALLRIYTAPDGSPADYAPGNVPLQSEKYLKISLKGYREGSKTTIIGFPGSTDRYASSAKVEYLTSVELPIQTEVRGAQMDIIKKWMDRDPEVRRKYSNHFFNLSNAQELYLGELQCYKRFQVADEKRAQEAELNAWLNTHPALQAQWGDPASALRDRYSRVAEAQKNAHYFRECLIRGTQLEPVAVRTGSLAERYSEGRVAGIRRASARNFDQTDLRVERELFRYGLEMFYEHVPDSLLGPCQREMKQRFGQDYDEMCAYLWDGSWISDPEEVEIYLDPEEDMKTFLNVHANDPLMRFFADAKIRAYNDAIEEAEGTPDISELSRDYTHAMRAMQLAKKRNPYPDANSTMRVNFGRVQALDPRDAVHYDYFSTAAGLLDKHDPGNYDFCIPADMKAALEMAPRTMRINFITNNDSTGGNSGSPVLNKRGEIIGLLFDGNKESLASEVLYTPDYNRSVNVDIRYVVWILREYAHFNRILDELGLSEKHTKN
nr:S46 family peptidase [Bacteroidales bacterium]